MLWYCIAIVSLILSCGIMHTVHNLEYSDLEKLGKACHFLHQCPLFNPPLLPGGCYCDSACFTYQDCCIGNQTQSEGQAAPPKSVSCLNVGDGSLFGVHVVSGCSSDWSGSLEVKENCEGIYNFKDPSDAAPVVSTVDGITYKNRYCAECNKAEIESLREFGLKLSCEDVEDLTAELLSYNEEMEKWGIYRLDPGGNSKFTECQLRFYCSGDLMNYVHICPLHMISECAPDWPLPEYKVMCKEYMAAVYYGNLVFRNPHCAFCNNRDVSALLCTRKNKRIKFTDLLDLNLGFDLGILIKINDICPLNQAYDPFFKKCRRLGCAVPGYSMRRGKCVKDG